CASLETTSAFCGTTPLPDSLFWHLHSAPNQTNYKFEPHVCQFDDTNLHKKFGFMYFKSLQALKTAALERSLRLKRTAARAGGSHLHFPSIRHKSSVYQ